MTQVLIKNVSDKPLRFPDMPEILPGKTLPVSKEMADYLSTNPAAQIVQPQAEAPQTETQPRPLASKKK